MFKLLELLQGPVVVVHRLVMLAAAGGHLLAAWPLGQILVAAQDVDLLPDRTAQVERGRAQFQGLHHAANERHGPVKGQIAVAQPLQVGALRLAAGLV